MHRLTRDQVRRVDRVCVDEFRLPGVVLMENAARSVVEATFVRRDVRAATVVCGGGNNGGDGYAIARLLHNRGVDVAIVAVVPRDQLRGDARIMADVAHAMKIESRDAIEGEVVFDCVFGTGLNKPPGGRSAAMIDAINASGAFVVAVDVPSGLDCDSGRPLGACVRADLTVTFVAEKIGFASDDAKAFLGEVVVGEIGCPRDAVERATKTPDV